MKTPTPYHFEKQLGRYELWPKNHPEPHTYIGIIQTLDDAAFIVRACNAHDELLIAVKGLLDAYVPKANETAAKEGEASLHSAVREARAAIAHAEGRGA